jgi:hypothetical protein
MYNSYKEIVSEAVAVEAQVYITLRSRTIMRAVPVAVAAVRPKIKRAMTSGNLEVSEYALILLSLLREKVGGGQPSKGKAECAYILFLFYLNCLIDSINGYERMNGSDYIYYEALARLVISAINVYNGDCLELLDIIYTDLIDADISSIKNKDFKECVQVAAHNVALQSVGLRQGDIPYSGKNYRNSVKHKESIVEFDKITAKVKGMPFQQRKLHIISILQAYIQSLTVTSKPMVAVKMVKAPYIYVGGKKTRDMKRKKRNGSPRRKTLRKTRRHR